MHRRLQEQGVDRSQFSRISAAAALAVVVGALALLATAAFESAAARDWEQEALPLAPQAAVEDPAFKCRDFRNRVVRTVDVPSLGDAGRAEFVQGSPLIMVDPVLMATLPEKLQTFFHLHECGHHALGHLFAPTDRSEKEADCWAVVEGRKRAGFIKDDIISWKPYFAASRGDSFGHLPGPQRVEFLLGCFDQ